MTDYRTFRRRWLILAALVPIIVSSEVYWLAFAPISSSIERFFGVDELSVTLFAMSYLIMYILLVMPASWVVDRYGFKASVTIGIVLLVIPAALRYLYAESFTMAIVCQFVMAASQPFLINISTKVPSNWFPVKERATASGILVMAQYIGFIIPMAFSAPLFDLGMKSMMGIYALIAIAAAVLALILTRENPPLPPGPPEPKEDMNFRSIKALFGKKQYLMVLVIGFISIGLLNTLLSMIESILVPKNMGDMAGIAGVVFVVAGVVGAVLIPMFSDRIKKRMVLVKAGVLLLLALLALLTFVAVPGFILAICAVIGFCVMGLAPILFQHGAESAYPSKEGTSFGLVMLMGQISGVVFMLVFEMLDAVGIIWSMAFLLCVAAIQIPVAFGMRESRLFMQSKAQS